MRMELPGALYGALAHRARRSQRYVEALVAPWRDRVWLATTPPLASQSAR